MLFQLLSGEVGIATEFLFLLPANNPNKPVLSAGLLVLDNFFNFKGELLFEGVGLITSASLVNLEDTGDMIFFGDKTSTGAVASLTCSYFYLAFLAFTFSSSIILRAFCTSHYPYLKLT